MKKNILLLDITLLAGMSAMEQKVGTEVTDNKDGIKWGLDNTTTVITL